MTRGVKLIGKKEFTIAAFDPKYEAFLVHIAVLSVNLGDKVYLSQKA